MKTLFNIPNTSKWSDNAMNPPIENCLTNFSINDETLLERVKEELASYVPKHDDKLDAMAYSMQVLGMFSEDGNQQSFREGEK